MNKKKWIILGSSIVGFFVLLFILKATGVIKSSNGVRVAIEEAKNRDIVETVTASGKIYPVNEVKVSPDVSGELIELVVEEGQKVNQGQFLGRIDASLYNSQVQRANAQVNQSKAGIENAKAQLQQIEAQLQQARNTYERNLKLFNSKIISAAEFEQVQTAFKTAQANYSAAKQNINSSSYGTETAIATLSEANQNVRRTSLYAPMNGIVSKLNVKKGERVVGTAQMAGTEILRIADMSRMKVDVEIGENEIQKIDINDFAYIEVDAFPKRKFKGRVSKIAEYNNGNGQAAAISDQVTNYTISVEIDPDSYADLLQISSKFPFKPGMSALVEIVTQENKGVLTVPINAVTTREEDTTEVKQRKLDEIEDFKEYVFVVQTDNTVKQTKVKSAIQDNAYIQIIEGLKSGDKVVVAPYRAISRDLKDKAKIQVVKKENLYEAESTQKD